MFPSFRRRRLYAILVFIVGATTLFLCFQLFSVQILDSYSSEGEGPRLGRGAMPRPVASERYDPRERRGDAAARAKDRHGAELGLPPRSKSDIACTANCSANKHDIPLNDFHADAHVNQIHNKQQYSLLEKRKSKLNQGGVKFDGALGAKRENAARDGSQDGSRDRDNNMDQGGESDAVLKHFDGFDSWDALERRYDHFNPSPGNASFHTVRGASARWRHLYETNTLIFTCLFTREKIPHNRVNDDYCDCADSTDEPGTSACPNSRFYCGFESASTRSWAPGSRVNDGICDCCDGSDEWGGVLPPDHVRLNDGLVHYGVRHAPCTDRCDDLRAEESRRADILRRGAVLKLDYIAAARRQPNPNMLYGLDGEFYRLSQKCWSVTVSKYTYSVCPFGTVEQRDGGKELAIGRTARWVSYRRGDLRLELGEGDGLNCPGGTVRSTVVVFECSVEDRVESVAESEVCAYTVHFSTPAAC